MSYINSKKLVIFEDTKFELKCMETCIYKTLLIIIL